MSLCAICATLDLGPDEIDNDIPTPRYHSKTEDDTVRLGTYASLVEKESSCENCNFFLKVLHSSSRYIDRKEDLTGKVVFLNSKRLDVRSARNEDRSSYCCDDLLFDICIGEDCVGEKDPEIDIRRDIPKDPLDEKCVKQITSWMKECSSEHSCCSNSEEVVLPVMIIEIPYNTALPPRLIASKGRKGKYIVLSHCIDEENDHKYTLKELETFQNGIDVNTLPKVFHEAILVTQKLGFQYLWINSLCNNDTTTFPPLKFTSIYLNSTLLLSTDNTPNTSTSFLHPRTLLYSPPLGSHLNRFYRLRCLRWKDDITSSTLSSQSLSALERIFAPRVVHFTKRQVVWECAGGWKYEAAGVEDRSYGSGQARMEYRKGFVQPFLQPSRMAAEDVDVDAKKALATRLEVWHSCADEFSRRTKGNLDSKMEIAAVLAKELDDGNLGDYLGGIWSADLPYGLAWARQMNVLTTSTIYRAPSWSWGSVDGNINTLFLARQEATEDDTIWNEKYLPKLISHKMVPSSSDVYGLVKAGSSITLSAKLTPFRTLSEAFSPTRGMEVMMNPAFDQDPVFDCGCCIPRSADVQKAAADKFEKSVDHYVVIVLGRSTRGEGMMKSVTCLIAKAVEGQGEGVFERVGLVMLCVFDHGETDEVVGKLMERFEEVGWVEREVVLV